MDIEVASEGGYNVGWIGKGEFLEYNVDLTESGSYDVLLRVATDIWATKEIEVSIDDVSVGTVSLGHTGGWQSYTNVLIEDVTIEAGTREIQLDALTSQFNVNYIELV